MPDTDTPSLDTLRELISEVAPTTRDRELAADEPLVTGRVLDSMSTLELVGRLEEHYGIVIDAHEVDVENFDTLAAMARFIAAKTRDSEPATPS